MSKEKGKIDPNETVEFDPNDLGREEDPAQEIDLRSLGVQPGETIAGRTGRTGRTERTIIVEPTVEFAPRVSFPRSLTYQEILEAGELGVSVRFGDGKTKVYVLRREELGEEIFIYDDDRRLPMLAVFPEGELRVGGAFYYMPMDEHSDEEVMVLGEVVDIAVNNPESGGGRTIKKRTPDINTSGLTDTDAQPESDAAPTIVERAPGIALSKGEMARLDRLVGVGGLKCAKEIVHMAGMAVILARVLDSAAYNDVDLDLLPKYGNFRGRFSAAYNGGNIDAMRAVLQEVILYLKTAKKYLEKERPEGLREQTGGRIRAFLKGLLGGK